MRWYVQVAAASVAVFAAASVARAAIEFDQNVTNNAIYGTGNNNGAYTTDRNERGVEVGLRAHVRLPVPLNQFNSNGDGTYSFAAGNVGGEPLWNFDWSINSDYLDPTSSGNNLNAYTYLLSVDSDPSAAANFISIDPVAVIFGIFAPDNSFGDNSTAQSAGVEVGNPFDTVGYGALVAGNNLVQNSSRETFFPFNAGAFDPNVDGTYDIRLQVFSGSTQLAQTDIQVIVGAGASSVTPEAGALFVWGGLAVCSGAFAWRRKAKSA